MGTNTNNTNTVVVVKIALAILAAVTMLLTSSITAEAATTNKTVLTKSTVTVTNCKKVTGKKGLYSAKVLNKKNRKVRLTFKSAGTVSVKTTSGTTRYNIVAKYQNGSRKKTAKKTPVVASHMKLKGVKKISPAANMQLDKANDKYFVIGKATISFKDGSKLTVKPQAKTVNLGKRVVKIGETFYSPTINTRDTYKWEKKYWSASSSKDSVVKANSMKVEYGNRNNAPDITYVGAAEGSTTLTTTSPGGVKYVLNVTVKKPEVEASDNGNDLPGAGEEASADSGESATVITDETGGNGNNEGTGEASAETGEAAARAAEREAQIQALGEARTMVKDDTISLTLPEGFTYVASTQAGNRGGVVDVAVNGNVVTIKTIGYGVAYISFYGDGATLQKQIVVQ